MPNNFLIVSGDTGSIITITCRRYDNKKVIDLTGKTVKIRWRKDANTTITKTMTNSIPETAGIATYQFVADEIIPPFMHFEVEITDATSKIIKSLNLIQVPVREAMAL